MSSDEEDETVPESVSDYQFLSSHNEPISFVVLPLEWNKGVKPDGKPHQVFLRGVMDNGLRKIYKQVTAWKYDLSYKKLEMSVLSSEGHWIKLLKPWKPYNDIIRTILVTLHLLHFVKWNPQQSQKNLWDHLNKSFSMFERRPCVEDLEDHLPLIKEAIESDSRLATSEILSAFLMEKPWEMKSLDQQDLKPPFIVNDVDENEDQWDDETYENEDESDEEDCYDHVCAICDNGGDVYICDGKCMRSFHATPKDGDDSACESLCLTEEEKQAIVNVPFICENCKYKEHQCFACGELGSSDGPRPEVFCCVNGTCGHFYHPHCVSKLLHPGNSAAAKELGQRIVAGEQFACPAHTCHVCKEVEMKSVKELQFAVCRRCPRAYHRKCLPRDIMSENDVGEYGIVRAWEELIPNRVLIYCLDHEIDPYICTPDRNHIKFPERERKNELPVEKILTKKSVALEKNAVKDVSVKPPKGVDKVSSTSVKRDLSRKRVENFHLPASSKKQKVPSDGNSLRKLKESEIDAGEISLSEKVFATSLGSDLERETMTKKVDNSLSLDADSERRILDLIEDASSSISLKQVKKRHGLPSTYAQSKNLANEITLGKVEAAVKALHTALEKLEEGGRVQDSKAVCDVTLLVQVLKWRDKLKVYLSPFLYGIRYTSFGRHFTKIEKLNEIVDILRWYIQNGDMLVDFCCGSNDFSCLMKKKLDEMGKSCSFKNYDILQAKNDFNFERKDWMMVKPDELPDGSQLVMGLNPPFGIRGSLANKFICKALEFKPKLLILIVPRETKRLDVMEPPYDLIWEDDQMLAGKSFYLPGSIDVNDKQIDDWNVSAPILYLWSSQDWAPKYRVIAAKHGHSSGTLKNCRLDGSHSEMPVPDSAQQCHDADKSSVKHGEYLQIGNPENSEQKDKVSTGKSLNNKGLPRDVNGSEGGKKYKAATSSSHNGKGLPQDLNGSVGVKNRTQAKDDSGSKSKNFGVKGKNKRRFPKDNSVFRGKGKWKRGLMEDKPSSKQPVSHHHLPNMPDHLENYSPEFHETRSQAHSERSDYQQHSRRNSSTHLPYIDTRHNEDLQVDDSTHEPFLDTGYSGSHQMDEYDEAHEIDDLVRKYSSKGDVSDPVMPSRQMYVPSPAPDYVFEASADPRMGHHDGRAISFAEPNPWNRRTAFPSSSGPRFPSPHMETMGTTAMQRYASRLDEADHGMASNVVPGHYHPAQTGSQGSLGFAPAPYNRSYSPKNSSGWLND